MRNARCLGSLLAVTMTVGAWGERDASACGGCLQPPPSQSVDSSITAERMIFSISKNQTTLYDEINFSGSPSSFAWVLPIAGKVTVGLSADILFATMDQLTATVVTAPPNYCPPPDVPAAPGGGQGSVAEDAGAVLVTVIAQQQVGPYETVQLASTDGSALTTWLQTNGYAVPSADAPVISYYVAKGMNFLAMKLVPGVGVNAMQPVRVTTPGASPVLPLRMVAVGTGATTGITLWVVADGRWEPQNFPFFTIGASDLTWDWSTDSSNYESVRLAKESALQGAGWQIESSLELSQYTFEQNLLTNVAYDFDGGSYLASADAGEADGGEPLQAANADLDVLFAGIAAPNARITRIRTDIAHSALSADLIIQAATDQSELSNLITPAQQINGCPASRDGGGTGGGAGREGGSVGLERFDGSSLDGSGDGDSSQSGDGHGVGAKSPSGVSNGGGCSVTTLSPLGVPLGTGAMLGLVGLGVSRSLRRRRSRTR
jgi:hypothetical protein